MALTKVTYSMIDGACVNVLDFGASSSATAAENKTAFEAALAASDSVFIPEGEYNINGPIYITGFGKKVFGAGIGATKITVSNSAVGFIAGNSGSTSETNHDLSISDMWIDGGTYPLQVGSSTSPLTFLGDVSRVRLTGGSSGGLFLYQAIASYNDLEITGNAKGIVSLVAGGDNTASMFNRCRIYQNTAEGCYLEQAWGFQFNECNFESNGKEGVKFDKTSGTTIANVTFNSCWFENNLTDGTLSSANVNTHLNDATYPSNINFYACEFNGVTGSGSGNIHVIGPFDNANYINNRFITPGTAAVSQAGYTNANGFSTDNPAVFSNYGRINFVNGEIKLTAAATSNAGAGGNRVSLGSTTATTVGAAGGATALPATPLGYLIAYVGTTEVKIPYYVAS